MPFASLHRTSVSCRSFSGLLRPYPPQSWFLSELSSAHSGASSSFRINRGWKTGTPIMSGSGETLPHVNDFTVEDFESDLDAPTEWFASIPEAIEDIRQGKVALFFIHIQVSCLIGIRQGMMWKRRIGHILMLSWTTGQHLCAACTHLYWFFPVVPWIVVVSHLDSSTVFCSWLLCLDFVAYTGSWWWG